MINIAREKLKNIVNGLFRVNLSHSSYYGLYINYQKWSQEIFRALATVHEILSPLALSQKSYTLYVQLSYSNNLSMLGYVNVDTNPENIELN